MRGGLVRGGLVRGGLVNSDTLALANEKIKVVISNYFSIVIVVCVMFYSAIIINETDCVVIMFSALMGSVFKNIDDKGLVITNLHITLLLWAVVTIATSMILNDAIGVFTIIPFMLVRWVSGLYSPIRMDERGAFYSTIYASLCLGVGYVLPMSIVFKLDPFSSFIAFVAFVSTYSYVKNIRVIFFMRVSLWIQIFATTLLMLWSLYIYYKSGLWVI